MYAPIFRFEQTADAIGWEGMLTFPKHLIPPLSFSTSAFVFLWICVSLHGFFRWLIKVCFCHFACAMKKTWQDIKSNVYKKTDKRCNSHETKDVENNEEIRSAPTMVFSVIGDSESFAPRPWPKTVFQTALIEAAKSGGGMLVTKKSFHMRHYSILPKQKANNFFVRLFKYIRLSEILVLL